MGSRKRVLAAIVGVAIAFGVGGWFFGQQVKNPAEVAAEVAPPPLQEIRVPVESRELTDDIVTRVYVAFDNTAGVEVNPNVTSSDPPIVTGRVPERNAVLDNGNVLVEVSERPVFVLEGELPASRTIRFGTDGPDVQQLEEALLALGFFEGSPDSEFDADTEAAIERLYESEGYAPPELTTAEAAELKLARDLVTQSEESVVDAEEALTEAAITETESQRLDRILAEEQRRDAWADRQQQLANWQDMDPAIQSAKAIEETAEEQYRKALADSDKAKTLVHPETGEVPTTEEVEAYVRIAEDLGKTLVEAREATAKAIAESDADTEAAEMLELEKRQYDIATLRYEEGLERLVPDTTLQEEALESRKEALEKAREDLADLEDRLGPHLPDHEFVFLDNLPRNISQVTVDRGSFVRSGVPVVQVAGDELLVEGAVNENQRPELSQGQRIVIDDAALDLTVEGTLSRLDDVVDGNDDFAGRFYFQVELEGEYDVEQLVGIKNFRSVIPIGRSEGEVLAVPRNALYTTFEDDVEVQVEQPDGSLKKVKVTLGLQPELGGYVEVIPVNPEELKLGDYVTVVQEAEDEDSEEDEADEDEADEETSDEEAETSEEDEAGDEETEPAESDEGEDG